MARRIAGAPVRLLLVEDDGELTALLLRLLRSEGYDVTNATDGQRGLHVGLTREFDVMILDRGLPALEGLDLITALRRSGVSTPVLVLSARGTPGDRVAGLDAGAEDYLAKPFDIPELLARLRALLRRHTDGARVLAIGERFLDVDACLVTSERVPRQRDDGAVLLSRRETELLALLAARPSRVFTREELLSRVFTAAGNPIIVDTYVYYCRRKLGRDVIATIRGVGYQLGRA